MKRQSLKRPGYDCLRHPCGKRGCGTVQGAGHGICSEQWIYAVSDGDVALTLCVHSGVFPDSVPPETVADTGSIYPLPAGLSLHVGFPVEGGSDGDPCEYVEGGKCYQRGRYTGYLGAEEFWDAHAGQDTGFTQPESFWQAMEEMLVAWASSARAERIERPPT